MTTEQDVETTIKQLKRTVERLSACSKDRVAMEEWRLSVADKYKHLDIKQPYLFNLLVTDELDNKAEYLYSWLFLEKMDAARYHKLEFVYVKYTFVSSHVERLIRQFEGVACCGDKTRWIINKYIDYIRDAKIPSHVPCWYVPQRDPVLWFAWIDTMAQLYYGNMLPYAQALVLLTDAQSKEGVDA